MIYFKPQMMMLAFAAGLLQQHVLTYAACDKNSPNCIVDGVECKNDICTNKNHCCSCAEIHCGQGKNQKIFCGSVCPITTPTQAPTI